MKKGLIVVILISSILSGCVLFEEKGASHAVIHTSQEETITQIAERLEDTKELYDTVVIAADSSLLISYKVKHLYRFDMKGIEKDLEAWLKDQYPDQEITLSSDYKIFLESFQLFEKLSQKNISEKEALSEMKKIISLKNELT
ncbi:sporulation protein [Jeotgalibacillus sp. R-1-5s-1]|uniref:sporulation protein n=1 Tax=Jeotgalibacillus sp. R-1-5s-1 TaxID=2555897 RepID=UPI0010695846|nr:sporulation protein [Jeotgalibacillus sp. R-1-5s-1]TFD97583.1 sporulation protein [Jeotgalibacillus sp. R-1-5s-1]